MFLGAVLGPFCPNFGKNEFSLRKGLCQFLNVLIILTLHQKSEKTNEPFLRKMLSCWTDRQTTMTLQDAPQDGGALSVFKCFDYLTLHQKSEKTNEPFLRKMLSCWTDRQTTMTLQDPPQDGGPIIKTTLSFPEFISTHQKPVYSINFFVRYSQFQSPTIRVEQLFMTIPTSIFFNQLLISMNLYHTLEIYLI